MNSIKFLLIFGVFFVTPFTFNQLLAQSSPDALTEKLDKLLNNNSGGSSSTSGGAQINAQEGYKSFVQNEMQNIFSKFSELEQQEIEEITFAEINSRRIELATKLCEQDQRACFLIDEYKSYKSKEDLPKEFKSLELFGQEIFSGYSNEFNFFDSLPIDNEYIIKLGDKVQISLFGGFEYEGLIQVDLNGSILVPNIGEYQVAGLTYSEVSKKIKTDISNKFPGTEAYISLNSIRSKQIFALGNVRTPGTYVLNAFGTVLNAVISSGGVKNNSSLRSIKIVSKDNSVKTIDLYDLLIFGDVSSSDFLLNDGDSLLVGGLESSVSILGEIIRPAIYEIKDKQTLSDVISFALGTTPFADMQNISIERLLVGGEKKILNPKDLNFTLQNGDKITINSSEGQTVQSVKLLGEIRNAGAYSIELHPTLGSLINVNKDLLENTYTGFGIVKRLNFASRSYRLVMFNLNNQTTIDDFKLNSGDQIFVFSKDDILYSQSKEVQSYLINSFKSNDDSSPIMDSPDPNSNICLSSLESLTGNPVSKLIKAKLAIIPKPLVQNCTDLLSNNPDLLPILIINSIPVTGNVRFPGLYPTTRDLNALDIFNLAGGVLVSKLNTIPSFDVGIRARGFGNYPYEALKDLTNITMLNLQIDNSTMPTGYVSLQGEFINPGTYEISQNTTLSDIYKRAGGLTADAYPLAGIFTRQSVKEIEEEAISRSKAELSEILSSAVASGYLQQNSTDLIGLIGLMTSLDDAKAIGRLVTELNPNLLNSNPSLDIKLYDGDVIYMPKLLNTVTVVGQVLNPVTVPHKVGESFNYYLSLAGGLQKDADKSNIYSLQPNGVSLRRKNGLSIPVLPFMPFEKDDILPGATLIVPRQARPLDSLALVETITPILANLSVTAASIAAISDN